MGTDLLKTMTDGELDDLLTEIELELEVRRQKRVREACQVSIGNPAAQRLAGAARGVLARQARREARDAAAGEDGHG